ncbi:MAG: hypothetical protein JW702_05580 [Clostridiales bacterium]|nr:hypothetical protein [Clostridiales bacterium]
MQKTKLNISLLISVVFLGMLSVTLMLPIAQAIETHGHYTIQPIANDEGVFASRCDHTMDPPGADPSNRFTGCGILALFADYVGYEHATYYYMRGYGGPNSTDYDWVTDGSMTCRYQIDANYYYQYDSRPPVFSTDWWWDGYYQPDKTISQSIQAGTVGAKTSTWFKTVSQPTQYVFISSTISADDMYWDDPNWKDEEF